MNDITLSPGGVADSPALQAMLNARPHGVTFEQAAAKNLIYQGNGIVCQRMMCNSLTGCNNQGGCPEHPDWKKVLDFCGPNSTPAMSMDGSYWRLTPADARQNLVTATKEATGLSQLPTPYNVVGMY